MRAPLLCSHGTPLPCQHPPANHANPRELKPAEPHAKTPSHKGKNEHARRGRGLSKLSTVLRATIRCADLESVAAAPSRSVGVPPTFKFPVSGFSSPPSAFRFQLSAALPSVSPRLRESPLLVATALRCRASTPPANPANPRELKPAETHTKPQSHKGRRSLKERGRPAHIQVSGFSSPSSAIRLSSIRVHCPSFAGNSLRCRARRRPRIPRIAANKEPAQNLTRSHQGTKVEEHSRSVGVPAHPPKTCKPRFPVAEHEACFDNAAFRLPSPLRVTAPP